MPLKVKRCILKIGEDPPSGLQFWCPACDEAHVVSISPGGWTWNGSEDAPTFSPSVKCEVGYWDEAQKKQVILKCCHSEVAAGMIKFCRDCTHALVNQTVAVPNWPKRQDFA